MARLKSRQLDWVILPNSKRAGPVIPDGVQRYDLFNLKNREAIRYGRRRWGINLVWADPEKSDNIGFLRKSNGKEPVRFGEWVAISVRKGKWLRHQHRRTGINLSWSKNPVFEWRLLGGREGAEIVSGNRVGLFNRKEGDFMFYDPRDWGINLKWWRDKGIRSWTRKEAIRWGRRNKGTLIELGKLGKDLL